MVLGDQGDGSFELHVLGRSSRHWLSLGDETTTKDFETVHSIDPLTARHVILAQEVREIGRLCIAPDMPPIMTR